jgi:hypothetical protein
MDTGMTQMTQSTSRVKRASRLIGALSLGLIATSFLPGPVKGTEAAPEDFINGSGISYAQLYRVGPTAGRLSLAPIFGLSLADYLNTVGRGETKVADWAGIGVAERALPDNTPKLKVASTDPDSAEGKTVVVGGQSDGTTGGGFAEMYARATDAPFGESRFRMNSLAIPGLIEMRDSQSHTTVGIVKSGLRESQASVEIGTLDLGGVVRLEGLRWHTLQQTGAATKSDGKFTVQGASIAGVPLPMPGGPSDLKAIIDPLNTALAPTGFKITLPTVEERLGQTEVSPLSFDIVNSPAGRQYLAPILERLQPAREPITDAFIDLAKQLEAAGFPTDLTVGVLAADLTLGIASGSSQLHIEVGGVRSFTEGETFDNPFTGVDFKPPVVAPTRTEFTPGKPGTPPVPGVPSDEGVLVAAPTVPGTRTIPGDRGGVAVAVGLIGLAVAIGIAVGDWYRMRRSRIAAEA